MASWQEMSLECRKAAQHMIVAGHYRSSISRSYYAVYCAVSHVLAEKFTFSHGGNNPSHTDLPNMILHNMSFLSQPRRWELRKTFLLLWKMRVEADYVPSAYLDRSTAVQALREAGSVQTLLGIDDG
jgi:uncharacterized protein (UPF0332 family)